MVVDSTLQLSQRRNVPIRYDRELVAKTLAAMERISQIRARRERAFYKRRMAGKKDRELQAARRLVATHEHLLPRMRGSEKRRLEEADAMEEDETVEHAAKRKIKKRTITTQRLVADGARGSFVELSETVQTRSMGDGDSDEEGMDVDDDE